jgi:hypothetical protein
MPAVPYSNCFPTLARVLVADPANASAEGLVITLKMLLWACEANAKVMAAMRDCPDLVDAIGVIARGTSEVTAAEAARLHERLTGRVTLVIGRGCYGTSSAWRTIHILHG